jgi:hypothetical protein
MWKWIGFYLLSVVVVPVTFGVLLWHRRRKEQ